MTIEYIDRMPSATEYIEGKRIDPKLTDAVSRAKAMQIVHSAIEAKIPFCIVADLIKGLPSADVIPNEHHQKVLKRTVDQDIEIARLKSELEAKEHDGCEGCRYQFFTEREEPCISCRQNYKDMWTKPYKIDCSNIEEVIRCKDCKFSFYDDDTEYYECSHGNGLASIELNGSEYCFYGVKR